MKKFLHLALLPMLVSCASTAKTELVPTLTEARVQSIKTLVDSGSFLPALQEISSIRVEPSGQIPSSDVDSIESQALTALSQAFGKAVNDKNFRDAIRLYSSALAYGKPELVSGWSEKTLFVNLAESLDASGERLLSLLARMRALTFGEPTEADLADALSYASRLGDAAAVKTITKWMKKLGFTPSPEASPQPESGADFKKMINGMVTIWVNRGIRIEKGVGYPDRVIGSGFFIDSRGFLLTNYHVIKSEVDPQYEGYSRLYVRLSETSSDKVPAKVVGYDTVFDLALIKAELTPEYVFSGLSTGTAAPGDRIFAIGSPAGLDKTITSGIVSAVGRRFLEMGDALQVDVPLNPGNSGGPLLDDRGDVIGIVFAGLQQFEGINFAIPYYWVEKVLPQLFGGGEVSHPWLGMALTETEKGLEVIYTVPDEPARKAGIEAGDIIEEIDGVKYTTLRDIQDALLEHIPPSLVRVGFTRGGEKREDILCLSSRPESPIEVALKRDSKDNVIYPLFGMRLEKVGSHFWKDDYIIRRVTKDSVADESGLSDNDPLTIQDWKVDTENGYATLQVYVKKKKQGFLESVVQIAAYLDTDNFV
jgi:S1-C subfamily serine protease